MPELTRPLADIGEEGDQLTTNLLNRFVHGDEGMRDPEPSLRAEEEEEEGEIGDTTEDTTDNEDEPPPDGMRLCLCSSQFCRS